MGGGESMGFYFALSMQCRDRGQSRGGGGGGGLPFDCPRSAWLVAGFCRTKHRRSRYYLVDRSVVVETGLRAYLQMTIVDFATLWTSRVWNAGIAITNATCKCFSWPWISQSKHIDSKMTLKANTIVMNYHLLKEDTLLIQAIIIMWRYQAEET